METEVGALRKATSFQVVAENLIAFSGFEIFLGTYIDRPTIWTPYKNLVIKSHQNFCLSMVMFWAHWSCRAVTVGCNA